MSALKRKALRKVELMSERSTLAAKARDMAILDALGSASIREVATAAGLSPARVHQIRHGR